MLGTEHSGGPLGRCWGVYIFSASILACASCDFLAIRYLCYTPNPLNIFNGEVRILQFKSSLWWIEKLLFLKDAHELLSIFCRKHASVVARILVSFPHCGWISNWAGWEPFLLDAGILVGCLQVLLNICKSSAWVCFQLLLSSVPGIQCSRFLA